MSDSEYSDEEVFSFDLPLHSLLNHTFQRHRIISKLLLLDTPEEEIFLSISSFCDPITQPSVDRVSIDLVSDCVIGLFAGKLNDSSLQPFELSLSFYKIIKNCLILLNCDDEVKLRGINNSDEKVDWKINLDLWLPNLSVNENDLKLIYMNLIICCYSIFKLYKFENDLCLNPFLQYLIKLWKIFTNLTLLGLEVDRRVEALGEEETPDLIKQVIRGSSAVRCILAMILNDDFKDRTHDLFHLNIYNFLSPVNRKGLGALFADVRWYIGAMLALGCELNEVVEILIDLEPNDRYDEDVLYMFDYEEIEANCDCEFDDEYDDEDEYEDGDARAAAAQGYGYEDGDRREIAVRSKPDIEFDEEGRDWRDIPREANIFFNTDFKFSGNVLTWAEFKEYVNSMVKEPVSSEICSKVVITTAWAVKQEYEDEIDKSVTRSLSNTKDTQGEQEKEDDQKITPDKIYTFLTFNGKFDQVLMFNPAAAYGILDEMFMAHGYRRVLIWYLTHMKLSLHLMNYIYEILIGQRGANKEHEYPFSRLGALVLSDVERAMLLHEFLNNCSVFLNKNFKELQSVSNYYLTEEFQNCEKIIKLIVLMIEMLIEANYINLAEYKTELSGLLIDWIIAVPESRELFFKISQVTDGDEGKQLAGPGTEANRGSPGEAPGASEVVLSSKNNLIRYKKFNKVLKTVLLNVFNKMENGVENFQPILNFFRDD